MPIDRALWTRTFSSRNPPSWPCPNCRDGRLSLQEKSLTTGETAHSHAGHEHSEWDPSWVVGRFSCMMQCRNCGEDVSVAGDYDIVQGYDEYEGHHYTNRYKPLFFRDAPAVIKIPEGTPEEVADELIRSFHLFWFDSFSCANRIRSSVEALLTTKKIVRTTLQTRKNGKKKRVPLSLHHRINAYEKINSEVGDALMAVKWLGNAGSHASPITHDDLLDAYDMMSHVLDVLYEQRAKQIARLSREINRRKKPRSAKRN